MRLTAVPVSKETHGGMPTGEFFTRDSVEVLPALIQKYGGKATLIYIDPPFMTGQTFQLRQRYGEKGYRNDSTRTINIEAYHDFSMRKQNEYLDMMKKVLTGCRELLHQDGTIYVHVDQRLSAHIRLLLDEVFGQKRFMNEIIWHYKSGGRSSNSFSHKHDNILVYAKDENPYFNVQAVAEKRGSEKRNNMKRVMGEDGHVYFTIKSAGKTYSYSADDLMSPGDVWNDIAHLQQKDPERTGYDTQKPEKLLERILLASSPEKGLAVDLFSGSGTTCAAAAKLGRRFLGCDSSMASECVVRKRLLETGKGFLLYPGNTEAPLPSLSIRYSTNGKKGYTVQMVSYSPEIENAALKGEIRQLKLEDSAMTGDKIMLGEECEGYEALDYWAAGHIQNRVFRVCAYSFRSGRNPALETVFEIPGGDGQPAIHTVDAYGNSNYFAIED